MRPVKASCSFSECIISNFGVFSLSSRICQSLACYRLTSEICVREITQNSLEAIATFGRLPTIDCDGSTESLCNFMGEGVWAIENLVHKITVRVDIEKDIDWAWNLPHLLVLKRV